MITAAFFRLFFRLAFPIEIHHEQLKVQLKWQTKYDDYGISPFFFAVFVKIKITKILFPR